jgi:NADH dehydrogenase FAD-containing subunit
MKLALQYLNDGDGNTQAIQMPINDWQKLVHKLKKYEQALKIKSDLQEAFTQVEELQKPKSKKQTLKDFINEL